jgi:hypothetical protein
MNNVPVRDPTSGALLASTSDYYTVQWAPTADEATAGISWPVYVLNHYAYNIATMAGTAALAPVVGDNVKRTNRHGRRWRPKVVDQRPLNFSMWVRGSYVDDRYVMPPDQRQQFLSNWEQLKSIFGVYDRQFLLTRRVDLPTGLVVQTATAEMAGDMDPTMQGDASATFTVDLIMADPFWYGTPFATSPVQPYWSAGGRTYPRTYDLNYGPNSGGTGLVGVVNAGMVSTPPLVTLYGRWVGPIVLQNNLLGQRLTLTPDATLGPNDVVVVDFDARSITLNGQSRYYWMSRTSKWWQLYPGLNQVFVRDASSGVPTGTAVISGKTRYW